MKQKAGILFLLRIFRIGLGILNLSLSAKYFGVSINRDVWILAFNTMIILDTALWGPINETFRAKFIFIKENEGEASALLQTKSLLLFTSLVSILVVLLVMLFPGVLAKVIAPSYHGDDREALLEMILLVAPCFLINQLIQIGISILNAYDSFYIPEIAGTVTVLLNLVLIIVLAPAIGIYSLLIAYYAGVFILLILIVLQLRRLRIKLLSDFKGVDIKHFYPFLLFSLPFFFPYFLGQLSAILEKTISSSLGIGVVSIIDYSRKFTDILLSVISSVMTTILVPALSRSFVQKKVRLFLNEFQQIWQVGLLAITFIISILTCCPDAFVKIFYARGNIEANKLVEITQLVRLYSWTAFSVFLYLIFGMALLSSGNGKKYAFWGIVAQVITIILNVSFVHQFGVYVFPLSMFISHMIVGFILFYKFPYQTKGLLMSSVKYIGILIMTVVVMFALNNYVFGSIFSFYKILINSVIILLLLIVQLFVFKLDERLLLGRIYQKIKGEY